MFIFRAIRVYTKWCTTVQYICNTVRFSGVLLNKMHKVSKKSSYVSQSPRGKFVKHVNFPVQNWLAKKLHRISCGGELFPCLLKCFCCIVEACTTVVHGTVHVGIIIRNKARQCGTVLYSTIVAKTVHICCHQIFMTEPTLSVLLPSNSPRSAYVLVLVQQKACVT